MIGFERSSLMMKKLLFVLFAILYLPIGVIFALAKRYR